MPSQLVVKLTAGDDAPERCAQAFTVASVAAASGVPVSLWLTGEASWFALPGGALLAVQDDDPRAADGPMTVAQHGRACVCTETGGTPVDQLPRTDRTVTQ